MLKKILFASMLLLAIVGCKTKTAFNYNEDFVKKEKELMPEMTKTENSVRKFLASEQFDSIGAAGAHMEKLIDAQLQKINDSPAPDVPGSEDFKKACVRYFSFIKSMYTGYKNFGYAKTDESRNEEMTKLRDIVNEKTTEMAAIKNAQLKYSSANGFKIEQ
ncbi:hypothetical protein [Ferruginibacter sp. HRS2-29]|uniref:hypothetical protein n=1 Tax=Ferruginibacter sp. HRS2-29 TaxID=2487334 RepID=UPI0020CD122B|nr:hypothetical protein [Ferruginibacter sp. HRS2-29]